MVLSYRLIDTTHCVLFIHIVKAPINLSIICPLTNFLGLLFLFWVVYFTLPCCLLWGILTCLMSFNVSAQSSTITLQNFQTPKNCCNYLKIWTMWLYHIVMSPKDADRMANSVDPDQTARAIWWVYTVCPDLVVQKLRIIMLSVHPILYEGEINIC